MKGCLTLPLRLAFWAILLAVGLGIWFFRDDLEGWIRGNWRVSTPVSARGRADPHTAKRAQAKIDSLLGWRADSVTLTASDVATLVGAALVNAGVPALDSLEVELRDRSIVVRGLVDPRLMPRQYLEWLLKRDRTVRLEITGELTIRRAGEAELHVSRMRVESLPVPQFMIERLLRQAGPRGAEGSLSFPVPDGVSGIRVRSAGVTLYGPARNR